MQKDVLANSMAGSSSKKGHNDIWKKIWYLPVSNVVRNFLWRACYDILPTRENLCRRIIIQDPLCTLYGGEIESVFHILWQCPSAMDVWLMGPKKIQKSSFPGPDFLHVVEGLLKKCDLDDFVFFVTLARRIWLRRNEVNHGGVFTSPSLIIQQTTTAIQEYAMVQGPAQEDVLICPRETNAAICWNAPEQGWCKANWDVAVDIESGRMGLSAVIRDTAGNVVAAQCEMQRGYLSPVAAKAKAALVTVQLCRELGVSMVHFEGDAKVVVDAVNSAEADGSWLGHLIEDIKRNLISLAGWRMSFVRREGNHMAHKLTKYAILKNITATWRGEVPACLHDQIALEILSIGP